MGGGLRHGSYVADILLPDDKVRGERRGEEEEDELRAGEGFWEGCQRQYNGMREQMRGGEMIHKWTDIYIIDCVTTSRAAQGGEIAHFASSLFKYRKSSTVV